ncbi:M6 family metalloprotease domain-containing protein [uncultured Alistipes sp.]|nr:M6 family metalloprotease domain-containing protein [uncultured Alistipes sp.]
MLFLLTLLLGCGATGRATSWEPTINQVVWKGDVKRLILLVETSDRPFYTPNAREEYDRMLNGENYTGLGCVGSARDFLIDNSGGKFRPQFIVAGPLRLSKSMGYYGGKPQPDEGTDGDVGKLVMEACRLAKEQYDIDFSELDYNDDGKVDNVYLFYSGPNDTTVPTPWPHASGVAGGGLVIDGKLVDSYAISQEMASETVRGGYTTFLHEFGHTLGLTDDYSGRLGRFSIYCNGTFNGGIIPVNFNVMERLMLGWLDCEEIDHDGTYTLEPLARNKGLILRTNNPDEYFLFENRSNASDVTLWDSYFEYGGLLVWHIDRSDNIVTWTDGSGTHTTTAMGMWGNNSPNAAPTHPCHELIEADNINDPSQYRAGMYFPGSRYQTELSSRTHDEFKTWSGLPVSAEIYDIRQESNGDITFKVRNINTSSLSVSVKNSEGKLQTDAYVSLTPVEEVATQSQLITRAMQPAAGGKKITGNTGATGKCILSGIPIGKYQLLVDKEGYLIHTAYIDIVEGDNSVDVSLQALADLGGTELTWYTGQNARTVFFVAEQIRAAGWDSDDLAPHEGKKLTKVRVQFSGRPTGDLYVFTDDQVVYNKPMENVVENGVTTFDLSTENIVIEAGKSLKVGYLLTSDGGGIWPSTADQGCQVTGKGGLISTDRGKSWYLTNDLDANWAIWIELQEKVDDVPVEAIEFDDPTLEMAVGDKIMLRANILPINVLNRKVTWKSSDEAIATIDEKGYLKALATGEATITATSVQNPDISGSCTVYVKMSSDMVDIIPYQRDARISWPGYNPDCEWRVSWRRAGETEWNSAEPQAETKIYLHGLLPDTEYEGTIKAIGDETTSPVAFTFETNPLTSEYPVIELSKKRIKAGEAIPLIVSNIADDEHTIVWKVNGSVIDGDEYECVKSGTVELRAEISLDDGSTEVLINELEVMK